MVHTAGVTTFYPDVSHYQQGLSLAGASACMAKATEGTTFKDPAYASFKAQSAQRGIPFAAYHWLNTQDLGAQASNAFSVVGPTVGLMWDAEAAGATVPRIVDITHRYRALGGIVNLVYLPHWWWFDHLGSPSLQPLIDAGLSLVSSNYRQYSDFGLGWAPYGGMTPVIWQYSDNQILNGKPVDYNAFKGTVAQLAALFSGGTNMPLSQADVDAVVNGVFGRVVNAVSLGYSQPFSEYVKYIYGNSKDIEKLQSTVNKLIASGGADPAAVAAALAADPAFVQAIVDGIVTQIHEAKISFQGTATVTDA